MELVVDATIVFTGIIGKGVTKEIIFSEFVKLHSPNKLFDEIEKHKHRLLNITGFSESEFDELLAMIKKKISLAEESEYGQCIDESTKLIPDENDEPYLTLSLSLNKMPIWSNDPHFKKQSVVKVFDTNELVDKLKSLGFEFSTSATHFWFTLHQS